MAGKVLIVDDEPQVCSILSDMLVSLGYQVSVAGKGGDAISRVALEAPDLMLLDLNLPDMDGLEVLREMRKSSSTMPVVLISGSLSVPDTVEAMKLGAIHCLSKPLRYKELEQCVGEAISGVVLQREIICNGLPKCPIVVASQAMKRVTDDIHKVSLSSASTVLILGETGTGKEVVARYLHHLSRRSKGNFVAVNCAAIPENLIESELFGHERGAFTDAKAHRRGLFEEAHGGTLFLDEIGELPLGLQAKLLRVLQERVIRPVGSNRDIPVDVRIVAATNVDLARAVREGKVREDIYYRLMVIPLYVPPIRERKDDIVPLVEFFLKEFGKEFSVPVRPLTEENKAILKAYAWPGNVRELRNCVERTVLLGLDSVRPIPGLAPVPADRAGTPSTPGSSARPDRVLLELDDTSLECAERTLIMQVMARVYGNKNQAAALLGINRTTLYRKLTAMGVACDGEVIANGN